MNQVSKPKLYIIGGPNGSGKTTFAKEFLPNYADCFEFVNADLIASGLSPFQPERAAIEAGRLMLDYWAVFDNSGDLPSMIVSEESSKLTILDNELFEQIFQHTE